MSVWATTVWATCVWADDVWFGMTGCGGGGTTGVPLSHLVLFFDEDD